MPHFVSDCARSIPLLQNEEQIIGRVFRVANECGRFEENDIEIRINPLAVYAVGRMREGFIHVLAHIMEGRSIEQRSGLSRSIVNELVSMFPDVSMSP